MFSKCVIKNQHGLAIGFLLVVLNTVAVLLVLGTLLYTRVLYKRPTITESTERARLEKTQLIQPKHADLYVVPFQQMTVNIAQNPATPGSRPGKLRYITLAFALEVKSPEHQELIDAARPQLLDALIQKLGKKTFDELTNVHGRFLLRSEIIEMGNSMLKSPVISGVYFTHFIVQ